MPTQPPTPPATLLPLSGTDDHYRLSAGDDLYRRAGHDRPYRAYRDHLERLARAADPLARFRRPLDG